MPFEVVNGPSTSKGYINSVLRDSLDLIYIAYLDDILIHSENAKTHTHDVRIVLEHLLKHGLYVKFSEMCI